MKILTNSKERRYKTPFHAYQFANIRNLESILIDIQNGTLPCDIGEMFDVSFPINDILDEDMTKGMQSPWKTDDNVPF